MQKLDPKAVWLFFLSGTVGIFLFLFFIGIGFAFPVFMAISEGNGMGFGFVGFLLIIVPVFVLIAFIWAKLTYENYKYELKPEGFRKEYGVIWKKYVTIPYNRIQNVDIHRGVFARLLGLSDLNIQTAGSSMSRGYKLNAEGRLPGLSRNDAEIVRDELIKRAGSNGKDIGV